MDISQLYLTNEVDNTISYTIYFAGWHSGPIQLCSGSANRILDAEYCFFRSSDTVEQEYAISLGHQNGCIRPDGQKGVLYSSSKYI